MNQTITKENNYAKNNLSKNVLKDINSLLSGKYDTSQNIKLREHTPKVLVKSGIKDLPMLMNSSHILDNILTETEAKNKNIYKRGTNYHGLGVKNYLETINSIDNPVAIYRWTNQQSKKYTDKDYVLLTNNFFDGKQIIVPIYIETKGNYNYTRLNTNKIKSIYGINDIEQTLNNRVKKGQMIKIYEKKRTSHYGQYRRNG